MFSYDYYLSPPPYKKVCFVILAGLRLCGPIQNSLAGLIASVDADFDGLDGAATCTWKIHYRDFNKKIQLHFVIMKLHETELCKGRHVKVHTKILNP